MASNDLSRRASAASSSEMSITDPSVVSKPLLKDEKVSPKPKMKKSPLKLKAGESGVDRKASMNPRSTSPDLPFINEPDADTKANISTGKLSDDQGNYEQFKKPMDKSVNSPNVGPSLQKKQERARKKKEAKEAKAREAKIKVEGKDKDGDMNAEVSASTYKVKDTPSVDDGGIPSTSEAPVKSTKKSTKEATTTDGATKKSKKRKADVEGDKEPKKKKAKKDEPTKPKVPKPKGPVDVEKQCGVLLPNGGFCARSLTCKSHSMGAKRSVPGRSLPYDLLLAQYQKKNQAKQQKAALSANAPLPEDLDASGPIDSDEERDAVIAAIARSRPKPLDQHIYISTRQKYGFIRMKEMLRTAFAGRGGPGGLFAIGDSGSGSAATTAAAPPGMNAGGTGTGSVAGVDVARENSSGNILVAGAGAGAGAGVTTNSMGSQKPANTAAPNGTIV